VYISAQMVLRMVATTFCITALGIPAKNATLTIAALSITIKQPTLSIEPKQHRALTIYNINDI
jgi:hypothetical protein